MDLTGRAQAEFESLLAPILDQAYGVALRLTRNRADAEDLVQEAALLAYRGFGTFVRGTNFRAWFLRVLTNAFLSARRRQRPLDHAVSLDEAPPPPPPPGAVVEDPDAVLAELKGSGAPAAVAKELSRRLGISRQDAYRRLTR